MSTKKILLGLAGVVLLLLLSGFLWARSILTSDAVRARLADQISQTLGHPVVVGSMAVSIYPRLGVTLRDVSIGETTFVTVRSLNVATDFAAILSRRIEHATVRLNGARITLPLPPLSIMASAPAHDVDAEPAVEITSIDEVVLNGVDIVSGGRTLRGDIEVVPQGKGVLVKKLTIAANTMTLTATGTITDLAGPVGTLAIKAGALDFDQLLEFANDFAGGVTATMNAAAPTPASPAPAARQPVVASVPAQRAPAAAVVPMNLSVSIEAERATMSRLVVDHVSGRAVATEDIVSISPLTFGLFGGRYEGAISATLGDKQPTFHWTANVSNIDVAAATAFGGHGDLISGTLSGHVDLIGRGPTAATALKTARGTAQIEVVNGVVRNLGLVRGVGNAASLSLEGLQRAAAGVSDVDERFSRFGATVTVSDGVATTQNLQFDAPDLQMTATGTVKLDASAVNLRGQLQLSESLSQQVPSRMLRLSKDQGRVVLPATITGPAADPIVQIDNGDIARRALVNTATAPAKAPRAIGRIFRR